MFNPRICYNCYAANIENAWLKTDYRGILCHQCKTGEKALLVREELRFLKWTEKNSPKKLGDWQKKIDTAKLIRTFTRKIQYHGEFTLKSRQHLSEFR